ncbi:hypothetical protein Q5P01_021155 [Channa striata]|uniref:C2H2-type domain-containing protein n=1 Tax=Channa striata TaxID=64152 RepID=A0AA88LTS3_CHASR|nr:hypothetical protein Q5P01_021155 [Channa striata]
MDLHVATSTGVNKQRVNKKNKDWHKQLRLRKTVIEPPTMQSEDKSGPKIAEEWEHGTAWSSSKKSLQEAQQSQCTSTNTLRFTCCQCRDNLEYIPKDLVRHFEEKHRGSPPVFSCHACTFNTHEFSYLQVHLLSHKDTFSSCSFCNDNVQRTWSEFSAHLDMCHCQDGKYSCETCQTFSTGDVQVFLEHICMHNLALEGADDDVSLHTKDKNPLGTKTTTPVLHCQHCDYEASQKWLINKHVKAMHHVCQNGGQRKRKKVPSLAMKPNDPLPQINLRLTRSAVKDMCWLTQDCLSLPGKEFLDKYCHLSDPQTTLDETQQFLMKSVTGETDDQKWTKALQTVLSNVPQDMNLHPRLENGITSDLTYLTVKNKITVAQNGASYAKSLKRMASSDKETGFPESAADACCVVDQNGCQPNLNDHTLCAQTETKLSNDISASAQNEQFECSQMQEDRENQKLEAAQEEHSKQQESVDGDGINIASELKLTSGREEQASFRKVPPKKKRRTRRQRRKTRYKKVEKGSADLKIVLKKNPVKEKQWVSQSSVSPSGGGPTDHGLSSLHTTAETTADILQSAPVAEVHQKKRTKISKDNLDPSEASMSVAQLMTGLSPGCAARPTGSKNMDGNEPVVLEASLSPHPEMQEDKEKSLQFSETEVDKESSAANIEWSDSIAAAGTSPENVQLQASESGTIDHVCENENESATDGVTPLSSYTETSPVSQPVITSQAEINLEDSSLALSLERSNQSVEGVRDGELRVDSCSQLLTATHLPEGKASQLEPSAASGRLWQSVPKNLERTLKLVAINPSQLVKRPAGDQPVVVLNHPDADIPEVARIMAVVNRYRGEVQKVVLSRRTLNALSALNGEVPVTSDAAVASPDCAELGKNSVQERFILKLKLRRLSRKKYEVVGAVSPSGDAAPKFRCWFCGRIFASQETWMVHRQRHLMEWKRPNCENS